ncbi:hypothetical protein MFMK1_000425 [Metallumcola ferriviriculae]|uniref:Holin n=1 Tax=Metallumcola ferriviriculae TaxID=3039180 RepID=A0AAU0UK68_9FIRM|nr:hypothetical protein MFMK1_000425 [Desulfitibacteraceae bacterium MK1]
MQVIEALIFMALVVEFLTTVFKKLVSDRYSQLVSMAIGMFLCTIYQVGIFAAMELETPYPIVDYILSGIIVSRGSNALYELLGKKAGQGSRSQRK